MSDAQTELDARELSDQRVNGPVEYVTRTLGSGLKGYLKAGFLTSAGSTALFAAGTGAFWGAVGAVAGTFVLPGLGTVAGLAAGAAMGAVIGGVVGFGASFLFAPAVGVLGGIWGAITGVNQVSQENAQFHGQAVQAMERAEQRGAMHAMAAIQQARYLEEAQQVQQQQPLQKEVLGEATARYLAENPSSERSVGK